MNDRLLLLVVALAALTLAVGCGETDYSRMASNTGRLTVLADEEYGPLVAVMADTFKRNNPTAQIEVRIMPARAAVQGLLDALAAGPVNDTVTTVAVISRPLLDDEGKAVEKMIRESGTGEQLKSFRLAYDGLGVIVPAENRTRYAIREGLGRALLSPNPTMGMIDSSDSPAPAVFITLDPNSGIYHTMRRELTRGGDIKAPMRTYATSDSVIAAVARGEGIGVIGVWRARRDSARVRLLPLAYVDTIGVTRPAARSHPITLAGNGYPVKVPLTGFTFAPLRSLGVGFLVWMERNEQAERIFTYTALMQPANAKIRVQVEE